MICGLEQYGKPQSSLWTGAKTLFASALRIQQRFSSITPTFLGHRVGGLDTMLFEAWTLPPLPSYSS